MISVANRHNKLNFRKNFEVNVGFYASYSYAGGFGASVGLEFGFGGQFDPDYNLGAAYNVNSIGRKGQNANISVDGRMDNYSVSAWRDIKNSNSYGGSISYSGQLNDRSIFKGYTTSLNWSNGQGFSNSFNYSLSDQFVKDINQGVAGAWDGFSNAMGNNWNNVLGGFGWLMGRKEGNAQIVNETPEESYDRIAKKWREENGFEVNNVVDRGGLDDNDFDKAMRKLEDEFSTRNQKSETGWGYIKTIFRALLNKYGKEAYRHAEQEVSMKGIKNGEVGKAITNKLAKETIDLLEREVSNVKMLRDNELQNLFIQESDLLNKQDGTDIYKELNDIRKDIKDTSTSFENRINGLNASIANLENISIGLSSKDSELKIADTFKSINDSLSKINTDSFFKKRLAISYESNSAEYFLTKYYIQKSLSFGSTSDAPGSRQIANFNKDMTNPDIIKAYIDYLASVNKNRKTYLPAWL
jgi:hypothetical protein